MSKIQLRLIPFAAFVAMASPAAFSQEDVLIRKINSPGYVRGEDVRSEKCDWLVGRVRISKTYGAGLEAVTVTETRDYSLSQSIRPLLKKAAAEPSKKTENNLCDGPSTQIVMHPDSPEQVVLFSTGGCGTAGEERPGASARILRDLIDSYCPTTHAIPKE